MTLHRYRAITADGRRVRGTADATGLDELEARLRARGLELINGEACRAQPWTYRRRVPRAELIHFCFQLEQLLAAGIPILEALDELRNATAHPAFRQILGEVHADVAGGLPLSAAASRHPQAFNAVCCSLLHAGEHSGKLVAVLHDLAASLRRDEALARYSRRVALYPAIVGCLLLTAFCVALVFVVPELARLFLSTGQAVPLPTRLLIRLSDFVGRHGAALLAAGVLAAVAIAIALARSPALRLQHHRLLLRLPVVGALQRSLLLARFTTLLALLYRAGIPVTEALRHTEGTLGNLALAAGVRHAHDHIAEGRGLSAAFELTGLFPPLVGRMMRIGEHTGALDHALETAGRHYERQADDAIALLQTWMEPALTVVLGALVLWIAVAVLGPLYDLVTRLPL